jgi:glycosyltransferase involved in cell wall biosynthesis
MRVAFVDLVFSWPPNGGADIDLYHVLQGLQAAGHEVRLFGVHERGSYERGRFDPEGLPFPAERVVTGRRGLAPERLCPRLRGAVDAWAPEAVFVMHGFALKPHVIRALAHYPLVSRYYAHELPCARDALRFKDGAPCPCNFLRTPNVCRACALDGQKDAIRRWQLRTWQADYLAARAYAPDYAVFARDALGDVRVIVVSNRRMAEDLDGLHPDVRVIPGGADPAMFPADTPPAASDKKIIFMSGRVEAPTKGLDVLLAAGERLARARADFEIHATHFDPRLGRGWFRALGWLDHEEALRRCAVSTVVAVPSLWEEPFGLVAVEGMAARRPVAASRVGGLADIVRDGETGFLVPPGDPDALAGALARLLDDPPLCRRMGEAGRAVVEREYTWAGIIERHYEPLLEHLRRG